MRLLLIDLMRRGKIALASFGSLSVLGIAWWTIEGLEDAAQVRPILAGFAMGMTFSIAHTTTRHMERGVWYLAMSRRDNWRARWTFGAVVTPLCIVPALLLPAFIERTAAAAEAALLSILYTFAYAGFGCALIALATRPIRASAPWRQLDATAAALSDFAPLGLLVPGLTQQFHLATLPMRVGDITPGFGVCIIVAIGSGIAAYFHMPAPVGRTARVYAPGAEPGTLVKSAPAERHRESPRRAAPLSGLPLLLAHEYRWALILASAFTLFALVFVAAATKLWQAPSELFDALRTVLRSFDEPAPAGFTALPALQMLIAFGIFAAALGNRLSLRLRHLRVLPLSVNQTVLLLVFWPAAIWLTAWVVLLAIHYAVLGSAVTSFHLAGLLAWIGATALVRAVMLRLSNATASVLYCAMLLAAPFLLIVRSPSEPVLALFGLAWIAGAALINRAALRRAVIYRRREFVLGIMPMPEFPR